MNHLAALRFAPKVLLAVAPFICKPNANDYHDANRAFIFMP